MAINPSEAVLHVTTCCSHHCPFCYAIDDSILRMHQDYAILKRIVGAIAKAECKSILFVGGDPASHPQIVDLSLFAKSLGLETSILSNTLHFADHSAEQVIKAFDNIEITVHASSPRAHDCFCRKDGAYDFAVQNLKSLKSVSTHLGIIFNITPDTYQHIFEAIKRLIEIDNASIDHVVFQRIVSVGRAYQKNEWHLSMEFLESIFAQVEQVESAYKLQISFEDAFPRCIVPEKYRRYVQPCTWGQRGLSLDMYGNVAKCCTDPRYTIANILDTPIPEIWNTSPELTKRRSGFLVPQSCRDCYQYVDCGGGCILSSEMNGCNGDPLLRIIKGDSNADL